MFDIGFGEILVIFVVAVIVLGPERIPEASRAVGTVYARFLRSASAIRSEIESDRGYREVRALHGEVAGAIRNARNDIASLVPGREEGLRMSVDFPGTEAWPSSSPRVATESHKSKDEDPMPLENFKGAGTSVDAFGSPYSRVDANAKGPALSLDLTGLSVASVASPTTDRQIDDPRNNSK